MLDKIVIKGAREHNLKNIDLTLILGKDFDGRLVR